MKKILTLFVLIVVFKMNFANPIPPSAPWISELFWDASGNWQLEIGYGSFLAKSGYYDSLIIETPNFKYKITLPEAYDFDEFLILNQTLTGDTFNIERIGDSISLITYGYDYYDYTDTISTLIFGNYPGSFIGSPNDGESIALQNDLHKSWAIDKSPTPYGLNDQEGVCGKISGRLLDKLGNPIYFNETLALDFQFDISNNGLFTTFFLGGNRRFDSIANFHHDMTEYIHTWYTIQPIELEIVADQTYTGVDIVITDPDFVSIQESDKAKLIAISPNPVNNQLTIKGKISAGSICTLFDLKGTKMLQFNLENKEEQTLELPENIAPGIYVLNIGTETKTYYTKKIIVNSFK